MVGPKRSPQNLGCPALAERFVCHCSHCRRINCRPGILKMLASCTQHTERVLCSIIYCSSATATLELDHHDHVAFNLIKSKSSKYFPLFVLRSLQLHSNECLAVGFFSRLCPRQRRLQTHRRLPRLSIPRQYLEFADTSDNNHLGTTGFLETTTPTPR